MSEAARPPAVVSVIIPTHNRAKILARTLETISAQAFDERWELIVVANVCADDTVDIARSFASKLPLHVVEEPTPGVAAARNAGARVATGSVIIFLDDDILVQPDFVRQHVALQREFPGCWIAGATLNVADQDETAFSQFRRSLEWYRVKEGKPFPVDGFAGQSLSMLKSAFWDLGGFDERFRRASIEDYDLALRVKQAGATILFAPSILSIHNDWAGATIADFAERQRVYARCEYEMYKKWGEHYPRNAMVHKNWPPNLKRDGFGLFFRKTAKHMISAAPVMKAMVRASEVAEKLRLPKPMLHGLYRAVIAAAIYRGFREGLTE